MLNPSTITDAIVAALQTVPEVVAAMGNDASNIKAYHYLYGPDHRLAEAIYKMSAPSIMVVWDGTDGGNFNGYQIWKHRFNVYMRIGNQTGTETPAGYETLWYHVCNGSVSGGQNIRYTELIPGKTDIMDTPTITHMLDGEQMDYFCGVFNIPEIGDQQP